MHSINLTYISVWQSRPNVEDINLAWLTLPSELLHKYGSQSLESLLISCKMTTSVYVFSVFWCTEQNVSLPDSENTNRASGEISLIKSNPQTCRHVPHTAYVYRTAGDTALYLSWMMEKTNIGTGSISASNVSFWASVTQ